QAQEDGLAERGGGYLMLGQEQRGGSAGANDASLIDTMLDRAESENKVYWESMGEGLDEEGAGIPYEVSQKMKTFYIKPEFRDEAADLLIPQFMVEEEIAFFNEAGHRLLERDDLREGFTLRDRDTMIDFGSVQAELAKVDLDAGAEALPRAFRLNGFENEAVKKWFDSKPSESKRRLCKSIIIRRISKIDAIGDADIARYVERVMENMTDEQLSGLEQSPELYAKKIREKVESLLRKYESDRFHMMMEQDRIMCEPRFHLKEKISPPKSISSIPKSLYEEEDGNLNDYEKKVIYEIAALGNVRWWHRNISRNEFAINGAVTTYPDLIVRMESGKLLLVETKGDHLDNPESEVKARAGAEWANAAGRPFRYFMVFQTREPGYSGAYSYGRFMEIIKGL
ncbi:MAG: restriction endonuclease, partial [Lachnospiraceae bacterium]|nr:restriction endonuclease [Lachnospiraceae bacterium]